MTSFDIKNIIDNFIYYIFNILSEFIFIFKFKIKSKLKNNSKYKNIHKNERCFVFGTGPSINKIKTQHINIIKNETVFAVNSFYKIKLTEDIKPKYYTLLDNLYWEEWSPTFDILKKKYSNTTIITDIRAEKHLKKINKKILLYTKKYPFKKIDSSIDKNMFIGMNVISTTILCAIFMGFKKIYLLGTDYNAFCNLGHGHAYNDKNELDQSNYNLAFYLKFYWIGTEIHYLIRKYADSKNVEIVNCTENSLLDSYKKESLENVLNL